MARSPFDESRLPQWVLLNPNFLLLWAAYGISALGDHLSETALLAQLGAMQREDSTRLQALIQFGYFMPFVLVAPLAGWWADRFNRKWTMIASDLARGALMYSLIWMVDALLVRGAGDWAAVIPLAMAGFLGAFFSPARQALLPTLIRDNQIVRANAVIGALAPIATIASYVIGAHVAVTYGPVVNYRLDALTFLLSAILVASIRLRFARVVKHPPQHGLLAPLVVGFRYVRGHARVFQMILLGTVFWASAGAVTSALPAIVRDTFGGSLRDVGTYRGLVGVGMVGGATLMTIFGPSTPIPLAVIGSVFGGGFWVAMLALTVGLKIGALAAGVCLFMIGVHGAALIVTVNATLQRFVPDSRRGRVFGVSDMCLTGAMAASSGLLGLPDIPRLDRYVPWILALVAAGLTTAGLVAIGVYRRAEQRLPFVTSLVWKLVRFYGAFWCRLKREGPCTIPVVGPVILASNHRAAIDPLMIVATSPRRLPSFLVERRYYRIPGLNWFMRLIDCIPIDRQKPGKSSLAECLRKLERGEVVGIFPQGTFDRPDQPPLDARLGVGLLALRSGAVVIPVHIGGQTYTNSALGALLRRHRVQVRYGPPVNLADLAATARDRASQQQAAERIMRAIWDLASSGSPVMSGRLQPAG